MEEMNDLTNRLANLSDNELLKILSDNSKMYSDEAIHVANQIAQSRGLHSNFVDTEFKVITAGGRENGPFDVFIIKDLFFKKLINAETLVFIESQSQWLPLKKVFNISFWEAVGRDATNTVNFGKSVETTDFYNENKMKSETPNTLNSSDSISDISKVSEELETKEMIFKIDLSKRTILTETGDLILRMKPKILKAETLCYSDFKRTNLLYRIKPDSMFNKGNEHKIFNTKNEHIGVLKRTGANDFSLEIGSLQKKLIFQEIIKGSRVVSSVAKRGMGLLGALGEVARSFSPSTVSITDSTNTEIGVLEFNPSFGRTKFTLRTHIRLNETEFQAFLIANWKVAQNISIS